MCTKRLCVYGSLVLYILVLFGHLVHAEGRHSGFIKGPFTTGPEVTKACLECHAQQADDFIEDVHWTWSAVQEVPGHAGEVSLGKKNSINNFCIAVSSNWPR